MSNWKILRTFTYPHEAHIAQGFLDSEGIETIIQDELTAQVNNFYSNAIGGVKLLIAESDFEKGIDLLKKGGFISNGEEESTPTIEIIKLESKRDKELCPFCNSKNIAVMKEPNTLTIIVFYILGLFFPLFKKSFKCFDCEKEWKFKKH